MLHKINLVYNQLYQDRHFILEKNPIKKPLQVQTPVDLSAEIETKDIDKHNEIRPFKPP